MKVSEAVRFFDTSACLNLARPTSGTTSEPKRARKRPVSSTIRNRGQQKIDLYNFEHSDFANSKYVLTSPRSLEACSRLNIKVSNRLFSFDFQNKEKSDRSSRLANNTAASTFGRCSRRYRNGQSSNSNVS